MDFLKKENIYLWAVFKHLRLQQEPIGLMLRATEMEEHEKFYAAVESCF